MIVIDASTALSWYLEKAVSARARRALSTIVDDGAFAPGNFQSEVVHGLLNAERQRRIDESSVSAALADFLELPIRIELSDPHVMLTVARTHRLTAYDASYLALSVQLQAPLATIDENLAAAARSENLFYS